MSDIRGPIGHDLPEYEPGLPLQEVRRLQARVKVKVKVYKVPTGFWYWSHDCPSRPGVALGWPRATQAGALQAALRHARRCS